MKAKEYAKEFLENKFDGYGRVGVGRENGKKRGEHVAIFYKKKNVHALDSGTFWLSGLPDLPGSNTWFNACVRICTWLSCEVDGEPLLIMNAHLDHRNAKARLKSVGLILKRAGRMGARTGTSTDGKATIVMGDFNSGPEEEPIRILNEFLTDAFASSENEARGPQGTFNGFDPGAKLDQRIDYIFLLNLDVLSYTAADEKRENGRWISDHLAVIAEVAE